MNRRELVLKKLHSLSPEDERQAVNDLTRFVRARLRKGTKFDRTKSGAHCEKNLGEEAVNYYVGGAIQALYKPDGWDWKFEERSLKDQLKRIANKLISDEVVKYRKKKEQEENKPPPKLVAKDASELFDLMDISENDDETDMMLDKIIHIAKECTKDDDDLHYFTLLYFEKADFATIAQEMKLKIEQVYVLKRKLVRRLESRKDQFTFN